MAVDMLYNRQRGATYPRIMRWLVTGFHDTVGTYWSHRGPALKLMTFNQTM